jgi:histidine triad (HIT) family protein
MPEQDCLFCRIVSGEVPATVVLDNERHLAFMDIRPTNPGHLLVVPKQHHACLAEMPDEVIGPLFEEAARLGRAVSKVTAAPGFNVIVNNGAAAGQVIFHTHVHVIPRFEGDGHEHWSPQAVPEDRTLALAESIREVVAEIGTPSQ